MLFCITFRALRQSLKIKTKTIAQKLGVSPSYISNKELHYHLSPAQAEQFAGAIGFSASEILNIGYAAFD